MEDVMACAAQWLAQARHAVALTGAGLSTPSGIPDFRSQYTGLWENYDPLENATYHVFRHHPARFFNWIRPLTRQMFEAQPNAAHRALAQLERIGCLTQIVTQNIDGLQQRAGARHVVELHGDIRSGICVGCYQTFRSEQFAADFIEYGVIPTCPNCGSIIKPNIVLFGEALPVHALLSAKRAIGACDVLLVAGSSLEVAPASDLPQLARAHQARLIIVNQGTTYLDDFCDLLIHDDVAVVLPDIAARCAALRASAAQA
jgi:NAD-dependent deacetylase